MIHGSNQPMGAGGPYWGVLGGQRPPGVLAGSDFAGSVSSIHSIGAGPIAFSFTTLVTMIVTVMITLTLTRILTATDCYRLLLLLLLLLLFLLLKLHCCRRCYCYCKYCRYYLCCYFDLADIVVAVAVDTIVAVRCCHYCYCHCRAVESCCCRY